VRFWVIAAALQADNPRCKPKIRWRSVDANFEEVVAISLLAFLLRKAANIMIMGVCHFTALELPMMKDQQCLMLNWHSLLGGGSDMVVGPVAHKGSQYCHYGWMLSRTLVIIHDARPAIGDAPLTLIAWIGQPACDLPFYTELCLVTPLCIYDATLRLPKRTNYSRWLSVDAPLMVSQDTQQKSFGW
jgi:hypothetical protein